MKLLKPLIQTKIIQFAYQTDTDRFLRLALKYHRKSKLAIEFEDQIIYRVIGLELLFSSNDAELKFRFSRRLANLLGKTPEEREFIVKKVLVLYKLRSNIVHGNRFKIDQELISESEIWLRDSILSFISLMKRYDNQEKIISLLDDCGINENTRKTLQKISNQYIKRF